MAMGRFWFGGRGPRVLGLGLRFFVLTPSKLFCSGVLTMREFKATWALYIARQSETRMRSKN